MQSEDLEISKQVPSIMKPDSTTRFMDLAFMNSMGGSAFAYMLVQATTKTVAEFKRMQHAEN